MVQRLTDSTAGGPLESRQTGNSWQGVQFPQTSPKIGDVLLQLANGEIKVPVGLALQHRRSYDVGADESDLVVPGSKRSRLLEASDISFKAARHGSDGSVDGRHVQMLARTFTVSTAHTVHPLEEPSPLGLTLKKTPSFLDLVAMTVGQAAGNSSDLVLTDGGAQGLANRAGLPTQGKLKASNFPASTLKIGAWERVSKYEGDVVAKCYYAKRKLVWEVLENGLKSKIELQWSDISAIKASCSDGQVGTLEVEVSRPPLFFKETNPQPRKHTLWEATSDFTGGEATVCKRHALQFPEGVLNKHYEKLLQCDPRLKSLAGMSSSATETSQEQIFHPGGKDQQQQQPICSRVKAEVAISPMENRCSPSSVMESRGSDDSDGEECGQDTGFNSVVSSRLPEVDDQKTRGVVLVAGDLTTSDKDVLNEIAQILLGSDPAATKTVPPENGGGLLRVSSMTGFLGEDGGPWLPTSYAVSDWSLADCGAHGNEEYGPEEDGSNHNQRRNNDCEGDSEDEKPKLLVDGKRTNSASDLLVNLPRIASLPQLFQGRVL